MKKRKLYSYIRWSSDKQAKGSSLDRQLETARRVAHENGLELVEIIPRDACSGLLRNAFMAFKWLVQLTEGITHKSSF
ncbi:recombinase family protein [Enterobacter ludwigii]|uniref:recombinase family protein n=1 Tax=Enterobacter ludwigii TaxID=299767 RepID=UPI0039760B85